MCMQLASGLLKNDFFRDVQGARVESSRLTFSATRALAGSGRGEHLYVVEVGEVDVAGAVGLYF